MHCPPNTKPASFLPRPAVARLLPSSYFSTMPGIQSIRKSGELIILNIQTDHSATHLESIDSLLQLPSRLTI